MIADLYVHEKQADDKKKMSPLEKKEILIKSYQAMPADTKNRYALELASIIQALKTQPKQN